MKHSTWKRAYYGQEQQSTSGDSSGGDDGAAAAVVKRPIMVVQLTLLNNQLSAVYATATKVQFMRPLNACALLLVNSFALCGQTNVIRNSSSLKRNFVLCNLAFFCFYFVLKRFFK